MARDEAFPTHLIGQDAGDFDVEDPELAAAIEASYRAQLPGHGDNNMEDDELARAMEISRLEEEERQRRLQGGEGQSDPRDPWQAEDLGAAAGAGHAGSSSSSAAQAAPGPWRTGDTRQPRSDGDTFEDEEDFDLLPAEGASAHGSSRAPGSPAHGRMPMETDEDMDATLAAAIEASYAAQTEHGRLSSEDDLIQQALRISKMEEESRQRAALKEQQEMELQESILMDQIREQEEQKKRMEEAMAASQAAEEERRRQEEQEAKRSRIPPEPPAGEPGRVVIMIRTPDGKRLKRAFHGSGLVGVVYDYVDVETTVGSTPPQAYSLVSTMPRQEYKDRGVSLESAGLKGQCTLMMEHDDKA